MSLSSPSCYCLDGLHRPSNLRRQRMLIHLGTANAAAQKVFSICELHDGILARCDFVKAYKLGASEVRLCARWKGEGWKVKSLSHTKRKHVVGILKILRGGGISLDDSIRLCDASFRTLGRDVYGLCDHRWSQMVPVNLYSFATSYNILRIMSGFGGLAYAN